MGRLRKFEITVIDRFNSWLLLIIPKLNIYFVHAKFFFAHKPLTKTCMMRSAGQNVKILFTTDGRALDVQTDRRVRAQRYFP